MALKRKNASGEWERIIAGGVSFIWGSITGTLSNQTDLQDELNNKAKTTSIVPEYSSSSTYTVDSFCMHNGLRYKCNTAISTAEEWNDAHWTLTNVQTTLDTKANISDFAWTRYIVESLSTRAAFYVFVNNNMLIVGSDDFWYNGEASTQFVAGNVSAYIPSGKKIQWKSKTCMANVSGASFGSVWCDTGGNIVFYSTVAAPSYLNFQLVIPLVNS